MKFNTKGEKKRQPLQSKSVLITQLFSKELQGPAADVALWVEHLPSIKEVLHSTPSMKNKHNSKAEAKIEMIA